MSQSQLVARGTAPYEHRQPRQVQDQSAAHKKSEKTAWCQEHYDRKECDGDEASKSAMMTIWLVGCVSSVRFQRLRQVCHWIQRSYVSQVSVQIQYTFTVKMGRVCEGRTRRDCKKVHRAEKSSRRRRPSATSPSGLARVWAFAEQYHLVLQRSGRFHTVGCVRVLFEDVLLKEEFPLAEVARRALSEKIASLCKTSAKIFCRVVFRVSRTAHAMTAFKFPKEQDAADTTEGGYLQRGTLAGVAGSEELASGTALEVFFEVDSGMVPCSSSIFTEAAKRKEYNGCVVHRVVPRGWIQFGDLVDGSGAHSGEWGPVPEEEKFAIKHDCAGVLGMCKSRRGGSSQFYVTLRPYPEFDGFLVAIGKAVSGIQELIRFAQEGVPCDVNQRPLQDCFTIQSVEVISG